MVQRRVLAWTPHLRLRWLMDDLPLKGTSVDAPPDVTSGVRTLTNVQAAQTRGLTYGSVMFLVELPPLGGPSGRVGVARARDHLLQDRDTTTVDDHGRF
jgi:hypothetical protein